MNRRPAAARGRGRPRVRARHETLAFRSAVTLTLGFVALALMHETVVAALSDLLPLARLDHNWRIAAIVGLSALVALALAAPLAWLLTRRLVGRLARLAHAAAQPVEGDELPGPFEVEGRDEIAELAKGMNALRERVAEKQSEFNLRDIRRREFIAQVSHDLRTPLTAQIACLDRADQMVDKGDTPLRRTELRELLAVAKADADRVHTLADDLLEIARLDAGDKLYLEPVPPGELVRQAVRRLEPLAGQRGIRIDVNITTRLPVLHADGRRLTRAIENLLRNAIQHARSSVEVIAARSGDCVRFEVRDDGRGLPKESDFLDYLRRLSGDVRLTELAKRRARGDSAGLGLVVAQRVAEAHDGKVDAYNLSKGGAAFVLDIPVPPDMPSTADELAEG